MVNNFVRYLYLFFMCLFIYYTYIKIIKNEMKIKKVVIFFGIFVISLIDLYIRVNSDNFMSTIALIFLLSLLFSLKNDDGIGHILILSTISLSINYIIKFITLVVSFPFNTIFNIENDYINLILLIVLHIIMLLYVSRIKRIKNGVSFLKNNLHNDFLDFNMLNICMIISFIYFILLKNNAKEIREAMPYFVLYIVILCISIKKSIEAYYKQKLLIQDLNETKKELEDKIKEVEELEKENLGFNKRSHSLMYKQKSLEFKLNKLLMKSEFSDEMGLTDELKKISKQMQENEKLPKLDATGITEVDDMLNMMQEECRLNNIDFCLQVKGNIYQMTNNFIDKNDLATLLADHIKDAIIAINHTDNLNRSIMVRLGKIDDYFVVYFYDSGVEFPEEIFNELGKRPITAYAKEGGTGLGFMNTFDVLRKKNASLIVENLGRPCIDNYTKIIKIIFDNNHKIMFDKTKIL